MASLRTTTCRVHLAGDDDTAELEPSSSARVHMDMAKTSPTMMDSQDGRCHRDPTALKPSVQFDHHSVTSHFRTFNYSATLEYLVIVTCKVKKVVDDKY